MKLRNIVKTGVSKGRYHIHQNEAGCYNARVSLNLNIRDTVHGTSQLLILHMDLSLNPTVSSSKQRQCRIRRKSVTLNIQLYVTVNDKRLRDEPIEKCQLTMLVKSAVMT